MADYQLFIDGELGRRHRARPSPPTPGHRREDRRRRQGRPATTPWRAIEAARRGLRRRAVAADVGQGARRQAERRSPSSSTPTPPRSPRSRRATAAAPSEGDVRRRPRRRRHVPGFADMAENQPDVVELGAGPFPLVARTSCGASRSACAPASSRGTSRSSWRSGRSPRRSRPATLGAQAGDVHVAHGAAAGEWSPRPTSRPAS